MLEGKIEYRHGNKIYELSPGDSLFFDAEANHGPENMSEVPIRFLTIMVYQRNPKNRSFTGALKRPGNQYPRTTACPALVRGTQSPFQSFPIIFHIYLLQEARRLRGHSLADKMSPSSFPLRNKNCIAVQGKKPSNPESGSGEPV